MRFSVGILIGACMLGGCSPSGQFGHGQLLGSLPSTEQFADAAPVRERTSRLLWIRRIGLRRYKLTPPTTAKLRRRRLRAAGWLACSAPSAPNARLRLSRLRRENSLRPNRRRCRSPVPITATVPRSTSPPLHAPSPNGLSHWRTQARPQRLARNLRRLSPVR